MCKLYLVSYARHLSTDYNQSSMAGGNWTEVGSFSYKKCKQFISEMQISGDFAPLGNGQIIVQSVIIPVSTDP
jgi:hypothetical protein